MVPSQPSLIFENHREIVRAYENEENCQLAIGSLISRSDALSHLLTFVFAQKLRHLLDGIGSVVVLESSF